MTTETDVLTIRDQASALAARKGMNKARISLSDQWAVSTEGKSGYIYGRGDTLEAAYSDFAARIAVYWTEDDLYATLGMQVAA
jgi:hypothetical protein